MSQSWGDGDDVAWYQPANLSGFEERTNMRRSGWERAEEVEWE